MWPDTVQEVLDGDQAIALAYVTPAKGVMVTPVTNLGDHDAAAGTVQMNSSVGMPAKLAKIRRDPKVALVWHTRTHGDTDRPEYVLVQGTATISDPIPGQPYADRARWEHRTGKVETAPWWRWWLRVYYERVVITLHVERVVVWADLEATGDPVVHGTPLPPDPAPQAPPKNGTGARIDVAKAVRGAEKLPHVLLGWAGADGFPMVVPARIGPGFALTTAAHVPAGGRRAGVLAHWFSPQALSQRQQLHSGWLEHDGGTLAYAPHSQRGYAMPGSRLVYNAAVGFETRRRRRAAAATP